METARYGVHWTQGGIAFLHQARGGTNALGLRDPSPFRVRARKPCNHMIGLAQPNPARAHLDAFRRLLRDDPLVRFLLPLPGGGARVLYRQDGADNELLRITFLLKMSSPVTPPLRWVDGLTRQGVLDELQATDVQPFVLFGVTAARTGFAADLLRCAPTAPRRLLIVADDDVPLGEGLPRGGLWTTPLSDLAALPWEALGATVLRAYMRREWAEKDCWFTKEPTPANEPRPPRVPPA